MGKKGIIILIVLAVLGAAVAWFIVHGRYWVEGGRAPWAVINKEPGVLKEALAAGISGEEVSLAMRKAVGRSNLEAMGLLIDAGASPTAYDTGCYVEGALRWGRPKVARLLLERGADLSKCKTDLGIMMSNAIAFGGNEAPQADIIAVLSHLMAAGGRADAKGDKTVGTPIEEAQKHKLDQVLAFLQNPGQAPVAAGSSEVQPRGKAGSLDLADLKRVCAGEALVDAAPYVPQESNASKVLYFERRYEDWRWPGRGPGMPELPAWWTDFKEPANTQLVACVDLSDKTKVQDCRYKGGGGGISAYSAKIKITLYEAKIGRQLAAHAFEKGPPTCPVVKMGTQQEGLFPAYSKEMKDFLAPHVGGPS